ncbi:MAG: NAD(P)-dependent oxidoreductase [Sedimentisphaerales bacterium]|nr:NAD(P)-dependent oxidoreductase [Sedimentisphaerales bacterium]
MSETVGLVGLGLAGTAIARRLVAEGYDVTGFDVDPGRREDLSKDAVTIASSAAEVGEQAGRVILSLPDTSVVVQVVEGAGGILEAATPPNYVIDTTTGDPEQTSALAKRLAGRGVKLLDAPFSGSSQQLMNRDVVFMIGGEGSAFEACSDIFEALSGKVFYLGESGSGSRAKLASNLILGLNRLALAEGLAFAKKLGLEPQAFLELLKVTPAYSAAMDVKGDRMLKGDFEPEARLRQHCKDVSIMLKCAAQLGQDLPLSKVHLDVLQKAMEAGDGDLDNSAVIRELERRGSK